MAGSRHGRRNNRRRSPRIPIPTSPEGFDRMRVAMLESHFRGGTGGLSAESRDNRPTDTSIPSPTLSAATAPPDSPARSPTHSPSSASSTEGRTNVATTIRDLQSLSPVPPPSEHHSSHSKSEQKSGTTAEFDFTLAPEDTAHSSHGAVFRSRSLWPRSTPGRVTAAMAIRELESLSQIPAPAQLRSPESDASHAAAASSTESNLDPALRTKKTARSHSKPVPATRASRVKTTTHKHASPDSAQLATSTTTATRQTRSTGGRKPQIANLPDCYATALRTFHAAIRPIAQYHTSVQRLRAQPIGSRNWSWRCHALGPAFSLFPAAMRAFKNLYLLHNGKDSNGRPLRAATFAQIKGVFAQADELGDGGYHGLWKEWFESAAESVTDGMEELFQNSQGEDANVWLRECEVFEVAEMFVGLGDELEGVDELGAGAGEGGQEE
ncbi:hypothetical protein LTR66_004356 [Elasticomyces elasticus]|nr:hypothetical protein LTR66_004356 [Elasticomyces elasticus]